MKISICIPTYEYNGFGKECLEYSFVKIKEQLFEDFEVVISDQSNDFEIRDLCNSWKRKLHIKYIHNKKDIGNAAANMNNAINNCEGEWIKILCQDDYLAYSDSLLNISKHFDSTNNWLATGYIHTHDRKNFFSYHHPYLNPNIHTVNTIGTPSCVAFRNMPPIQQFDTNLTYYYDCEYYYRFLKDYGNPTFINKVTIINYLWDKSVTSKITQELVNEEINYVLTKHGLKNENTTP
jgi:glycosyltransferase involved in cell wall biosynthesis